MFSDASMRTSIASVVTSDRPPVELGSDASILLYASPVLIDFMDDNDDKETQQSIMAFLRGQFDEEVIETLAEYVTRYLVWRPSETGPPILSLKKLSDDPAENTRRRQRLIDEVMVRRSPPPKVLDHQERDAFIVSRMVHVRMIRLLDYLAMGKVLDEMEPFLEVHRNTHLMQKYTDDRMMPRLPPSDVEIDVAAIRPRKKRRWDSPRRPMNAFICFASEKYEEARRHLEDYGFDDSITHVAKRLGSLWRLMTDDEKEPFRKKAIEDAARQKRLL